MLIALSKSKSAIKDPPALKPDKKKSPFRQMQSVPTALVPAVRELARLHSPGRTQALLLGLQDLMREY